MAQKKQKTSTKKSPSRVSIVTRRSYDTVFESDSTYLLKLVAFVLLGTLWLKFHVPVTWFGMPFSGIPVGLLIGLLLVNKFEKYQVDRKIWYAILIVVTIICYFVPAGIIL
jgi:hypothetical protein